tara:strand:- start:274 stop:555 length:282 start_codon:yes stop_codon:yes gene_type:complete
MQQEHDQLFGGSFNAHKNWKKLREKHRKHEASGKGGPSAPERYIPYGGAGKGDMDRTSNQTKYELGMELIRIAKEHGKDSNEYKETLKAWREA